MKKKEIREKKKTNKMKYTIFKYIFTYVTKYGFFFEVETIITKEITTVNVYYTYIHTHRMDP